MYEGPDWTDFIIRWGDLDVYISDNPDQVNGDGNPITSEPNPDSSGEPEDPTPGRRSPACLEETLSELYLVILV
jgi:hypothetical protein